MSRRNAPRSKDSSVSVEPSKTPDPGPGGKIPLPADHADVCTGDTCWCRHC